MRPRREADAIRRNNLDTDTYLPFCGSSAITTEQVMCYRLRGSMPLNELAYVLGGDIVLSLFLFKGHHGNVLLVRIALDVGDECSRHGRHQGG